MSQSVEAREHAKQTARAQLDSIVELMDAIERARAGEEVVFEGESMDADDLEERALKPQTEHGHPTAHL